MERKRTWLCVDMNDCSVADRTEEVSGLRQLSPFQLASSLKQYPALDSCCPLPCFHSRNGRPFPSPHLKCQRQMCTYYLMTHSAASASYHPSATDSCHTWIPQPTAAPTSNHSSNSTRPPLHSNTSSATSTHVCVCVNSAYQEWYKWVQMVSVHGFHAKRSEG